MADDMHERIAAMVQTMEQFGGGHDGATVSEGEGDELDRLAAGINRMARRLRDANQAARRCMDLLQKVGLNFDIRMILAEDRATLIRTLTDAVRDELGVDRVTIFTVGADGGLVSDAAHGLETPLRLEPGRGIAGRVAATGQSYFTNDVRGDPWFDGSVDEVTGYATKNAMAIPCGPGPRPAAVLEFLNKPGGFGSSDQVIAEEAAVVVHAALERLRLVKSIQDMNATLKEADHVRTEFLINVSHELRTPLMSMSAAMDMLGESCAGKIDMREMELMQIVRRNYQRLERHVRDLLYLARMEAGRNLHCVSEVNIPSVVAAAVEQFEIAFHDKAFRVVTDVGRDLPAIMADPEQVDQVLSNLLSNAGKYTPANGVIGVEARRDGAGVRLCVWDTGPGVPPEYRERVFEKFFRVPGVTAPGTGIGLAIVKGTVEQHGGRVWVEAGDGRGARFQIFLPAAFPLPA